MRAVFQKMKRPLLFLLLGWLLLATPAFALTVVIDAGHGGHDRGGMPGQRISEKTYALDVAKRLRSTLENAGVKTVMTRSGDYFVSLSGRCAVANARRGAVFVSIHFNGAPREGANGIETYYYSRQSASLAAAIHRRVLSAAGTENRGVRRRGFYVIRNTRGPSVLVECGFLTNRREGARIAGSASHRQGLANAIARGILDRY